MVTLSAGWGMSTKPNARIDPDQPAIYQLRGCPCFLSYLSNLNNQTSR